MLPRFRATLFDGQTARAWAAEAAFDGDDLLLTVDGGAEQRVAAALLRREPDARRPTLRRTDWPDWRLLLDDAPPGIVRGYKRHGGADAASVRAIGGWSALAAGVAALLWWQGGAILAAGAPLLPQRMTEPIGRAVVAEFTGGKACAAPAGQAVIDRLAARLRPADGFAEPVTVTVADNGMVNALAAPGGQVVIFRGLIDAAKTPDEVAGVLAHELGHVQRRHANQALLRHFGVSMVLQGVGGDAAAMADTALLLARSREAEREADAEAVAMLRRAGMSPGGLADFFDRQQAKERGRKGGRDDLLDRLSSYARTHPQDAERLAVFRAAAAGAKPAPAMTAAEWAALRAICGAKPTAKVSRAG